MIPMMPRHAELWLPAYLRGRLTSLFGAPRKRPIHILFAIADHYEPDYGRPLPSVAIARVRRWLAEYPQMAACFRDADGRPPQHTFFYPAESYNPEHLDLLADLCGKGFGEVEVHLHHDHDSAENLRDTLERFREVLSSRHGLLSEDIAGRTRYAFVHGNWALDNSRADGRYCGVNNEIDILVETGCYADLTMPAAPDSSQSRMVNALYYAIDDPHRPRSHDGGPHVRVGAPPPPRGLLMIQGPLGIRWGAHRPFRPIVENGAIDHSPGHWPTMARFRHWVATGICVRGRENWVMVKVYTHGCPEQNADVLLGSKMRQFHEQLLAEFNDGDRWRLHYVTVRELANIVAAAEAGCDGDPAAFRSFRYRFRAGRIMGDK